MAIGGGAVSLFDGLWIFCGFLIISQGFAITRDDRVSGPENYPVRQLGRLYFYGGAI
jgi:hypothetical protein